MAILHMDLEWTTRRELLHKKLERYVHLTNLKQMK